jgi:hypothetical protein
MVILSFLLDAGDGSGARIAAFAGNGDRSISAMASRWL